MIEHRKSDERENYHFGDKNVFFHARGLKTPPNGQLLEPSAPRLALTYGELNPSAPLNGQLLEPSGPRLVLTYGELNLSAPLNGQLLEPSYSQRACLFYM